MRAIKKSQESALSYSKDELANLSVAEFRRILQSLRGSCRETTPEERKKREEELKTMSRSDLLREFGLDDV